MTNMPETRGKLTPDRPLSDLTWLRVGGPADYLFQPADAEDLAAFLKALDPEVAVFPMGVGSNLIVRDGGLRAVVIRLGRGFNGIEMEGNRVTAGAAALDAHVARKAADGGVDLTFLRTIPGAVGGAVRMNAGCYGTYTADVFVEARAVTRAGEVVTLTADDLNFRYRQTDLPEGWVITQATFEGPKGVPEELPQGDAYVLRTSVAQVLLEKEPPKEEKPEETPKVTGGVVSTSVASRAGRGRRACVKTSRAPWRDGHSNR